ncbi:tetratricopeptide repeat protein [Gluconacetobacter azotocaptans]|uniref:Tetratricopeptide repeat protein n=1 Tax=Gluconacetobacter azotocaptans TaxID=142834 RepID=A0A7W4JQA5_9PROT|nr:cellulose synthase subunit BcsC-related outer membrane protein [Gluconacetobacter azotocaptans]MBB2188933.1 tetratricopeptide repeat protein [Gluconacetobacter azotocaptans]GBQ25971.1 cellulose synthase operon protein C [Gluconacetobacter azotocaptans DSM 13594]
MTRALAGTGIGLLLLGASPLALSPGARAQVAGPVADQAGAAPNPNTGLVAILVERARYWYDHGQMDHAQQALAQARQIAPGDTRVLALSGEWALHAGDLEGARKVARSLTAIAPTAPETLRLNQVLQVQSVPDASIAQVRQLAREGHTGAAAAGYRKLFPDGPPSQYAVEYYETLAGAIGYREEGRAGLKKLVQADRNNMAAQIAYAQVLTWRAQTRADGLARLQQMAALPDLRPQDRDAIRQAWRAALNWLQEAPESVPYFDAWLALNPGDTDVQTLRTKAQGALSEQAVLERTQGYQALDAGDIEGAGAHFAAALTHAPNDGISLGGLGLVRVRQGRTQEARDLLERAVQADPENASQWRTALNGAKVAQAYSQVRTLQERGHLDEALRLADEMLALDPSQTGLLAMKADIARQQGHQAGAEDLYRQVLRKEPNNQTALQGLYHLLVGSGREQEAAPLMDRLRRLSPAFERQMQASDLVARAERTTNLDEKISLLRQGLEAQGSDPWVRLHLAQALVQAGNRDEARDVMAPLLADDRHPSTAALQASIYFANQNNDMRTVRQLLARLPRAGMTADIRRVADRAQDQELVENAPVDLPEARLYYLQIARKGHDPDGARGQLIANAMIDRHDPAGAALVLQVFLDTAPSPSVSQRLAYAGAFLRMQQPQKVRDLLGSIGEARLDDQQEQIRRDLQTGVAIMTSDRLNAQGRQADAYDVLQPALSASQPSPAARLALARLYQSSSRPGMALSISKAVVAHDPTDLDARLSVVRLALQTDDPDEADNQLREMTEQAPADPRTWLASAAIHRAGGNWVASLDDLSRARALRRQQIGADRAGDGVEGPTDNPFRASAPGVHAAQPGEQDPILAIIDNDVTSTAREFAPFVDVRPVFLGRSGVGSSKLTEGDLAMTGSFAVGLGRVSLGITPTVLASGTDSTADTTTGSAVGVATDAAYAWNWVKADVGSSPLGFRVANVLGGVELSPQVSNRLRLRVTAERRAVTDSILAYGGMRDASSGKSWGGVVRNRAHGQVEYGDEMMSFYAGGGFSYLQGSRTQDNEEYEAGAGGSVSVFHDAVHEVHLGIDLDWFKYNNNQYLFTLGHGGYFSPQSYFALLVPVRYAGHQGNWNWQIGGSAGYQSYSQRAAQAGLTTEEDPAYLARPRSASGVVGSVDALLSYQVTPTLRVGGNFIYQKAGPWSETTAGLSVHYDFMGMP